MILEIYLPSIFNDKDFLGLRMLAKPFKSKKGLNSPLFLLAAKKTQLTASS